MDSEKYKINLPYCREDTPEEYFVLKGKLLRVLKGQDIGIRSQKYMLTQRLLTYDAKATFN